MKHGDIYTRGNHTHALGGFDSLNWMMNTPIYHARSCLKRMSSSMWGHIQRYSGRINILRIQVVRRVSDNDYLSLDADGFTTWTKSI